MNFLFCSACGCQVEPSSRFCTGCSAKSTVDSTTNLPVVWQPHLGRMSKFFASQATLCLFTLLVFLGLVIALAPAGWLYANLQRQPSDGGQTATGDTRSVGITNSPVRCNQIVVIFNSAATVARVSALLEQLDTTIAFGPNENGAFELLVPSTSASGVTDALNRASDVVVSAALQRRCL